MRSDGIGPQPPYTAKQDASIATDRLAQKSRVFRNLRGVASGGVAVGGGLVAQAGNVQQGISELPERATEAVTFRD